MEKEFCNKLETALEIESKAVEAQDNFRDYDEWDSLSQLSLIAMLDENYGVEIESDDFESLETVRDLISEVKKRTSVN